MRAAILFSLVLSLAACGGDADRAPDFASGSAGREESVSAPPAAPAPARITGARTMPGKGATRSLSGASLAGAAGALQGTASVQPPSMLIRTGNASIKVDSLDPAIAQVRQLASSLGGYVANTSVQGGRDQVRGAELELKLPAARFDDAVSGLEPVGDVESVRVQAEDVGEEFVDMAARLANARRLEARLVELLATRTGRLEDVLAVERELARVREEIERYEGRLRYLQTRVAVSTLVVSLHEPHPVLGRTDNPLAEAVRDAWRNFVGFIAWMIAALGIVVPLAVLALGAWWLWRRLRTRYARRAAG